MNPNKVVGPPPRPPRPADRIVSSRTSGQSTSSFTTFGPEEASARIDSYGWQGITPLSGRDKSMADEGTVLRSRTSVVSDSCYSADSVDENDSHMPEAEVDTKVRIDKHRKAESGRVDRKSSKTAVDTKGKTPVGPPTISSRISPTDIRSINEAKSRLTAVTEEESEPDYDKPLPAPPSNASKSESSTSARRKKSHPILLQSEHKPWWEEQGIKESDLCLELDEGQHSSLEVQPNSTDRSEPSPATDDPSESGSTDSPEKSVLLTDIARSYVDEQGRAEDRERQERYRSEMRGKRLGMQMLQSRPTSQKESRARGGNKHDKWRFSVFENEIESRPSTANTSNEDNLGKLETTKETKRVTTNVSAAASTVTLPESEKVKMRPPPLRINTTRANQTPVPGLRPTNNSSKDISRHNYVKHPSALPTPLRVRQPSQKSQAAAATTREAVMRLSDGTPVQSPRLIRRNGEVLLPSKKETHARHSPVSPISAVSSSSSLNTWSHDEASLETGKQPDTPPTANAVHYERKQFRTGDEEDNKSDILEFYLDRYDAEVAPAVPEKSPRRSIVEGATAAEAVDAHSDASKRASTNTADSNPFRDQSDDEDDDERRHWEEEERHKRVAAILGRLRAKT